MKTFKPILYAGAVVGVLDITAACINARVLAGFAPAHVLQSVAGGLLGRVTYNGGFNGCPRPRDAFYDGADRGGYFLRAKPAVFLAQETFGSRGCGNALWSGGFRGQ